MAGDVSSRPENQLQERISRITEGILMLGGTLVGLWLLFIIVLSFIK